MLHRFSFQTFSAVTNQPTKQAVIFGNYVQQKLVTHTYLTRDEIHPALIIGYHNAHHLLVINQLYKLYMVYETIINIYSYILILYIA